MSFMMARLGVDGLDDYLKKLVQLRTSSNGVFAVKCHFHHFEMMQEKSQAWRDYAGVTRFIYVDRADKVGQAVSMARALQSNAFLSFETPRQAPLFYSQDFIEECLKEVMSQTTGWARWFDAHQIEPFRVKHEEFVRDVPGHLEMISQWLGVENDVEVPVNLPMAERQSDELNQEWKARFLSDRKKKIRELRDSRGNMWRARPWNTQTSVSRCSCRRALADFREKAIPI
jgi:LPS sulfotransferase NodH